MKMKKIIDTLSRRREWILSEMEKIEDRESGKFNRLNQEQRAIECALPVLEAEYQFRLSQVMGVDEPDAMRTREKVAA